jgi:hypothetical protein
MGGAVGKIGDAEGFAAGTERKYPDLGYGFFEADEGDAVAAGVPDGEGGAAVAASELAGAADAIEWDHPDADAVRVLAGIGGGFLDAADGVNDAGAVGGDRGGSELFQVQEIFRADEAVGRLGGQRGGEEREKQEGEKRAWEANHGDWHSAEAGHGVGQFSDDGEPILL